MGGFLLVCAIIGIIIIVFIGMQLRRNKNTFRCDGCGKNYSLDSHKYCIYAGEIMCENCHDAMIAPYKVERKI